MVLSTLSRARTSSRHAAASVVARFADASRSRITADASAQERARSSRGVSTSTASSSALGFADAPPRPKHRRVVITGVGLVTPLGVGADAVWSRLLAGASGIRRLLPEDLPEGLPGFEQLSVRVAACVPRGVDAHAFDLSRWCAEGHHLGDVFLPGAAPPPSPSSSASFDPTRSKIAPFAGFALAAASEALANARLSPADATDAQRARWGVAVGAGMGHVADVTNAGRLLERGALRRLSPFFVPRSANMAAGQVSMAHGLRGPNHAAATACATGAHAIGDAFRLVQRGDADVMLAGGTEGCGRNLRRGFARARALADPAAMGIDPDDPAGCCRPFDAARGGFVMGEGAGVLVLESLASARARGAPAAEIRGYGQAGDALHVTQPPTDGAGAASAMRAALVDAGFEPARVGYVNAHATGTRAGDAAESAALLGSVRRRPPDRRRAVSSTKGATGAFPGRRRRGGGGVRGDGGAHGRRAAHASSHDARSGGGASRGGLRAAGRRRERMRAAMSNSFGFGGTNASLVFAAPPPPDAEEGEET